MDYLQWGLLILIIVFIVSRIMLIKGVPNITAQQAKRKINNRNVQFIDVRTAREFANQHYRPFKNIPLANLRTSLNQLDKNKETIILCQSGARSARATKILLKQGFENVYNVQGGLRDWH